MATFERESSKSGEASAGASEPCARRTIFSSFRKAAIDLWGEDGLKRIGAAMPEAARQKTIDTVVISSEWLPETYVMAWYEAVWAGPARKQDAEYRLFLDRMMDFGFGRVRKLLLNLVQPPVIAEKSAELWRHDHTTGRMKTECSGHDIKMTLSDHLYTTTPLARLSIAEIVRYAVSLSRARSVVAQPHSLSGGDLIVRLRWE